MRTFATIVCAALFVSSESRANVAVAAVSNEAPPSKHVTSVGTLRVERYGAGSPAMIFIPGLACGSWVWSDAVKTYASQHAVYLVTLAGFDGIPATTGPALANADASLLALIAAEKIDRPIVVGHSLGGYLALRFGTEHPTLVRGIVAVDGTPILPPFAQMTVAQRDATADAVVAKMRGATPAEFAESQKATLTTMVTSATDVDAVATLAAKSDPGAVADYAGDLYRSDLRPDLAKLAVPTLEIAPVPTVAAPYEGPKAASAPMADRQAAYKAFYESLFPGAPNVTVETIPNAKHFVMLDQPQALFDDITRFIATLPA